MKYIDDKIKAFLKATEDVDANDKDDWQAWREKNVQELKDTGMCEWQASEAYTFIAEYTYHMLMLYIQGNFASEGLGGTPMGLKSEEWQKKVRHMAASFRWFWKKDDI